MDLQQNIITHSQIAELAWGKPEKFSISPAIQDWLLDKSSMTQRMQNHSDKVTVEVLHHDWQQPLTEEGQMLNLQPHDKSIIREVIMHCNHRPWLFGRTIIPESLCQGDLACLRDLDDTAIGKILFKNDKFLRGDFQISQLKANNEQLWARRSQFHIDGNALLLTEIFLPTMLTIISKKA